MNILCASDSLKGTLSSEKTALLLTRAAREVFGEVHCDSVPVADGGEGTTEAVIAAEQGEIVSVPVHGPMMEMVNAFYGRIDERRAVLEMAAASGLPLVPEDERNPLLATTYGTGELIRRVLEDGYREIAIAIGGSATNDGGMGCARALGVRFLDALGNELEGRGQDLEKVASIDASGIDRRIREAKITVMCDVTNPLCGPDGATWTFGAQKGADEAMQHRLEAGMKNYRNVIRDTFEVDPDQIPGSGAAGGLGAALMVFCHGEMKSGIETVLDLIHFDERLRGIDLVVTGEGRTDWQSCFGKVMQGVGNRAKKLGIPAVGLSGSLGKDADRIYEEGIESIMTTVDAPMPLAEALERAEELYYQGAIRMFRMIRIGMEIAGK